MAAIGGSIQAMWVGGRRFPVAADAEAQRVIGGWENEVQANGDASARIIKTRKPLMLEGVALQIDDDRGDQEYLQDKAAESEFFTIAIEYASGAIYQARATIVGELKASSQNATMPVSFSGPGQLTKQ
jgi:hypothetical protein